MLLLLLMLALDAVLISLLLALSSLLLLLLMLTLGVVLIALVLALA